MKKIFLLLFLFFIFFTITGPTAFAQVARPLEVEYPTIPETPTPTTVETPLPNYVKYIFNFSLWAAGFVALVVLVIAGVQYITSAGRPETLKDAKDRIFSALAGLLILFSSWLILTTINPQLKELEIKRPPVVIPSLFPGTYLCKEITDQISWVWTNIRYIEQNTNLSDSTIRQLAERINGYFEKINENCWRVPGSIEEIPKEFNDLSDARAYTVPSKDGSLYGAIFYDESKFKGKAQVVYGVTVEVLRFPITAIKSSSVKPFKLQKPRPEVYVQLYKLIDFNKADPTAASSTYNRSRIINYVSDYIPITEFDRVGSVKIEGELFIIFFREEATSDWRANGWPPDAEIDVITESDFNLYDNVMGGWCMESIFQFWKRYPCPKTMVIVSGGIY